jgi:hypothetical protein
MTTAVLDEPQTSPVLARLRVRPAPRREPPFDDELDPDVPRPHRCEQPLPFAVETEPVRVRVRRAESTYPDPTLAARGLLVGLIEAAAGKRAMRQLGDHLTLGVSCGLRDDFDRHARTGQRHWLQHAAVRSLHASEPALGVAEIAATLQVAGRVRAAALRFEFRHDRWRCTRLQLG